MDEIKKLLAQVDFEQFYRSKVRVKSRSGSEIRGLCPFPFHDDKIASFSANVENGLWKCFGCSLSGTIFQFIMKLEKVSFTEARKILEEFAGATVSLDSKVKSDKPKADRPRINPELPDKYLSNLLKTEKTLPWILEKKGLTLDTVKTYKLGFDGERITIPIYEKGILRNIRRYSRSKKPKMLSYHIKKDDKVDENWTYGEGRIFGADEIFSRLNETIFLHAGEWDKLLSSQHGFLAVTGTVGEETWKPEWTPLFKGRDVVIIYDMDDEGKRGSENAARNLIKVAASVKIIRLPLKGTKVEKDYSDYFLKKGGTIAGIKKLVEGTPLYVAPPPSAESLQQGVKSGKKGKEQFSIRDCSLRILEDYKIKSDDAKHWWWWNERRKAWRDFFELKLENILRKKFIPLEYLCKHNADEVIADLRGLSYVGPVPGDPDPRYIPFKNKDYDLETQRAEKPISDHFFRSRLRVNYNEDASKFSPIEDGYPHIEEFFRNVVKEEDIVSLKEIIAYSMYRDYPGAKLFILHGTGRNGKGKYIDIVEKILGEDNLSAVSIIDLIYNQFALANLWRRYMNVSSETARFAITHTERLKKLTGRDRININEKYRKMFEDRNFAKLVIISNEVPTSWDRTDAWMARQFFIEFPHRFLENINRNTRIISDIPEVEFEILAYDCLQKLQVLYSRDRDFVFTRHKSIEETRELYEELTDKLGHFLEESATYEFGRRSFFMVHDLNAKFNAWLKGQNLNAMSDKAIAMEMGQKGFSSQVKNIEGDSIRVYKGWQWKWEEKEEEEIDAEKDLQGELEI